MKTRNTLKLLTVVLTLSPAILYAQFDSLYQGDTIRVWTPNYIGGRVVGKLMGLRNDSLQLHVHKRDFFIPLRRIAKLEVARGKKRNAKKGSIIGALGGGLGLGLIGAIDVSGEQGEWSDPTPGEAFVGGFFIGSLFGGLTGAIIGSGIESTRWVKVPLEGLSVSPAILYAHDSLYQGDTIRVTALNYLGGRVVGKLMGLRNDSLQLHVYKRDFFIPLRRITKLEVARGKKRNAKKGSIIGALGGGLGLGLIGAFGASGEQGFGPSPSPGQAFGGGFFIGSLLGGLTGAIIGSGIESTRWVKVPLKGLSVKETPVLKTEGPERKPMQPAGAPARRWSLSFSLGATSSGPAKDIEKAMIRDGFDETSPGGFFGGPVGHPFSNTGFGEIGFPWSIQMEYFVNQKCDAALLISHNPIGLTSGYRTGPETYLFLNYYSTVISPILLCKLSRILYLGLGPALSINKMEQESGGEIIYREQKSHFGVLLQASLLYPQKTRFFVQCNVQYRYLGKATFGPFKDPYRGTSLAQLNPFEANFSHVFVGFGIGIRL